MNVLVTGAAGYIGGQIALQLKDAGYRVLGIDRRALPKHLEDVMHFTQADIDSDDARRCIIESRPDVIIHCAGTSLVGPSVKNPSEYYFNNVVKSLYLLEFILQVLPKTRIIFSSSASVYGEPVLNPISEVDPKEPLSPYGHSKLMVERIMESYATAYNLDYVAFRYFNAAGADSKRRHGQEPGATHIVARVLESVRDNAEFTLNGVEFPTADGTCVRDYVHVEDIARAHILALDTTLVPSGSYNLGSSTGISNRQIISTATEVTSKSIKVKLGEARAGDPAVLTASPEKFDAICPNWRKNNLKNIVQHAWEWYNR